MRWGGRGVISRQYSVLRIGGDWGNAIPDRVLTEIKPRVDAAVVPRSLRSANRHAETACKKKPVRSGRDDKTGLKVKGVARSLHSATAEGAVAPVGMTIWRSTETMGPTRRKTARKRASGRAGPFGFAQGRRNDRPSCFWWDGEGDNWQDVCRRNVPPVCHPERRAGGFCRTGVEGSRQGVMSLGAGGEDAGLLLVAPGKSALRSRNVGLKARMSESFFSRRQFLICFSLLIAARTSVRGSK